MRGGRRRKRRRRRKKERKKERRGERKKHKGDKERKLPQPFIVEYKVLCDQRALL